MMTVPHAKQKNIFCILLFSHELSKSTCYRFYSFFLIAIKYCLMRKQNLFNIPLNEYSLYFQSFSTKNKAQKTFSYMYPTH